MVPTSKSPRRPVVRFFKDLGRNYELILLVLPAVLIIWFFNYLPMYGVQIAFQDYSPALGYDGSPWVGLKHFERFFNSYNSRLVIKNTILLSLYSLLWSFPIPVVLALVLNQLRGDRFKKVVQTVTYLPYFISTVVLIGMLRLFLSPERGLYGVLMNALGVQNAPNPLTDPGLFRTVYIGSGIWQSTGFNSIVYLAALSSVDPTFYEAATIDGASRWQRVWNIDLPNILPTVAIMFILACGNLMNVGFEKAFLMQNQVNKSISEVISTYVYKVGIESAQYSFSTAVNLFNTMINVVLLLGMNFISRKLSGSSLL